MKKSLLLTITLVGGLLSCQTDSRETEEVADTETSTEVVVVDEVDNTEKTEQVFKEFTSLYQELLQIKDKDDFKTQGFKLDGPYYSWLQKIETLKSNPDSKLLLQKNILAGDLEQLGLAYAASRGQETEVTKTFNQIFSDAISDKE